MPVLNNNGFCYIGSSRWEVDKKVEVARGLNLEDSAKTIFPAFFAAFNRGINNNNIKLLDCILKFSKKTKQTTNCINLSELLICCNICEQTQGAY